MKNGNGKPLLLVNPASPQAWLLSVPNLPKQITVTVDVTMAAQDWMAVAEFAGRKGMTIGEALEYFVVNDHEVGEATNHLDDEDETASAIEERGAR
ncbi:MAG: hypothetical protein L0Y58_05735 [Verrucomicrobia subdivision 3 bacterium]|nr:hypothetical protein [Limisphaerales bacterium]